MVLHPKQQPGFELELKLVFDDQCVIQFRERAMMSLCAGEVPSSCVCARVLILRPFDLSLHANLPDAYCVCSFGNR